MQGFISKRFSQIIFITKVTQLFLGKTTMELPDFPSVVAQAHSHTLHPENNSRQKTSQAQTLVFVTTP
jgi:hypothetical protein